MRLSVFVDDARFAFAGFYFYKTRKERHFIVLVEAFPYSIRKDVDIASDDDGHGFPFKARKRITVPAVRVDKAPDAVLRIVV